MRILIGIMCLLVVGCRYLDSSLNVDYTVKVISADNQIFEVEMAIQNTPTGDIILQQHAYVEFTPINKMYALHADGSRVEIVSRKRRKSGSGPRLTDVQYILKNPKQGTVLLRYHIQVGKEIHAEHGRQSFHTYGYMNDQFALISSRNLFLLPELNINQIRAKFELPSGWVLGEQWEKKEGWLVPSVESEYLKEEFINANFVMGLLDHKSRKIGDTEVSVFVFQEWNQNQKEKLYETAFTLYKEAASVFNAEGSGKYIFGFVPETNEGLEIFTTENSFSQGLAMSPPTPERWLLCAESLLNRWLIYPTFRLEYEDRDDFWLLDGIPAYYAIRVCDKIGVLDGDAYLRAEKDKFVTGMVQRSFRRLIHALANDSSAVTVYHPLPDVRRLQAKGTYAEHRKRIAPYLVAFINEELKRQSNGKYDFTHILQYEYAKRRNLNLQKDLTHVVGKDISNIVMDYLHNVKKIVQKINAVADRPPSLPQDKPTGITQSQSDTLQILLTSHTRGFLEHCGCKVNQSGGVARRAKYIKELRHQNPDLLLIDAGNFFPWDKQTFRITEFTNRELDLYLSTMNMMDYDLATISYAELFYGDKLLKAKAENTKFPFVCANITQDGVPIAKPYVVLTSGTYKVGFLGLFQLPVQRSDKQFQIYQKQTQNLTILDPIETAQQYLPDLSKKCDVVFVVGNLDPILIREQLINIQGIDAVISITSSQAFVYEKDEQFVHVKQDESGFRNRMLVIYPYLELYGIEDLKIAIDKNNQVIGGRRTPVFLKEEIGEDFEVKKEIDAFYTKNFAEESKIDPITEWHQYFEQIDFVGSATCQTCHPQQFAQWKTTKHAFAINTLLDKKRHYQPKCVICHVTGAGYETGYKMGDLQHPLINVQCEACHGPGKRHSQNPTQYRLIKTIPEQLCTTCHDSEHSDFDFATYYPKKLF